eukprot:TRINITY_DN173_c2_g1_i5.p1 TRINITY_DN173_c2_g1~~TRINITY_DN173_c2_g1_i5.p1  ORF type:complete len:100 (-),score=2.11 TRINITY_DN173_c2_g1_i5:27-326(-)
MYVPKLQYVETVPGKALSNVTMVIPVPEMDAIHVCTKTSVCGNGVREGSEQCDDGNTNSGDGCDSSCNVESGYICSGERPDVCRNTQTCGKGISDRSEE